MKLLTTRQVAELFAVPQDRVCDWIASGQLEAVDVSTRPGGRATWRITAKAVDQFRRSRAARPRARANGNEQKQTPVEADQARTQGRRRGSNYFD